MLGKGAILTVLGFILAFSMYQVRMSSNVLDTSDNFTSQYVETMIHETALSAMNLAINKVWDQGVTNDSFFVKANSCTSRVLIFQVGTDTTKINVQTWGLLYDPDLQSIQKEVRNMSAFFAGGDVPLSDYFYFTNNSAGLFWTTGDTLWGPYHTNSICHTNGAPVFYGKVSAEQGINPDPTKPGNNAEYHDGWEIGETIPFPTDMSNLITEAINGNGGLPGAGGAPMNTKSLYNTVTHFNFQADGSVIRTIGINPPDTVQLTDIAPNGVIYSTNDIRVEGILNGQVTFYTDQNIWIDNDVRYEVNPFNDINSNDILGLVSEKNTYISYNAANNDGVTIMANIITVKGSYLAEKFHSRPVAVEYFVGSIAQNISGEHGVKTQKGKVSHGFNISLRYDPRLLAGLIKPPYYVSVKKFSLASWWE